MNTPFDPAFARRTDRRDFLKQSATGIAGGVLGATHLPGAARAQTGVASRKRPNVLILLADQHGARYTGFMGDPNVATPNMDAMAREGASFPHNTSNHPVCTPMRACCHSGRYGWQTGVLRNNVRLAHEEICFPEVFRDAGYATGYSGKWHIDGGVPEEQPGGFIPPGPARQGYDTEYLGYEKGHEFFDVWHYDKRGNKVFVEGYDWEPTWQTDRALDFIRRQRDADKPWMYFVSYGPPHLPLQTPQAWLDRYDPAQVDLKLNPRQARESAGYEDELRVAMQIYYAQVASVDHEIGRIRRGLEKLGVAEDTIVIYTTDHGDKLGNTGIVKNRNETMPDRPGAWFRSKASPEAHSSLTPLLVTGPGIRAGTHQHLSSSIDLAPTFVDLAGLPIPEPMIGRSVAGLCRGGDAPESRPIAMGLGNNWRAIYDGRYVYAPGNLLYDRKNDPWETENQLGQDPALERRLRDAFIETFEAAEEPNVEAYLPG